MYAVELSRSYPGEPMYWRMVHDTLTKLFNVETEAAKALVSEYAWQLSTVSPDERLLGFHAEPLDVAADLSGQTQIHAETVADYLAMAREIGWVKTGQPKVTRQLRPA